MVRLVRRGSNHSLPSTGAQEKISLGCFPLIKLSIFLFSNICESYPCFLVNNKERKKLKVFLKLKFKIFVSVIWTVDLFSQALGTAGLTFNCGLKVTKGGGGRGEVGFKSGTQRQSRQKQGWKVWSIESSCGQDIAAELQYWKFRLSYFKYLFGLRLTQMSVCTLSFLSCIYAKNNFK